MLSFFDQQSTATKIFSKDQISNTYTGKEEISTKNYNHFQVLLISLLQQILRLQDVDYLYFFLFVIQAVFFTLILVRKSRSNNCFKNGTISYLAKKCSSKVKNNLLSMLDIDLNRTDSDGKAPLHHYAEKNNVCFGELLLNGGADVNVKTTGLYRKKISPLYISAENGHKDFVQLLVKWKANVNELNGDEKKSALHVSAERGFVEIVDILIDAGADVNLADGRGNSALRYAVSHGNSKLNEMLFEKSKIILDANVLRLTNYLTHWTALYTAAVKHSKKLIQLLLDKGANINSIDNFGKTALHFVSNEIVDFLLEAGASANIRDMCGQTALHCAVQLRVNSETTLTLLKRTSVFDIGDMYDKTALHYSCNMDLKEVVEALLEAGADVDRRDKYGKTPLHYSVICKKNATIRLLIQRGANLDITDNNGQTALDEATMFSNDEAVAVLRQHGAKSSADIKEKNASAVVEYSTYTEVKSKTETTSSPSITTPPASTNTTSLRDDTTPSNAPRASTTTPDASDDTTPSTDTAPSMGTTLTASTNTPDARDDTTPSTDTAPSMDTTLTASTNTPDARDDTTPSTDTAPSMNTSPTVSTTTPNESDDTTPNTYTAPFMDTTQTASTTTPDASDDTIPSNDTATSIDTTPTVCNTTTPVDNVDTTTNPDIKTLATSTTTTGTSTNTTTQLENIKKSTVENESYQKHNLTQTKQQILNGNHQTFLENRLEMLDQSDTDNDHSAGLGLEKAYKQDTMDIQETTGAFDATKNKEKRNKNSTKPNTMGESCIEYVEETKQTRIKQTDANFPLLDFLDVIRRVLKTEMTTIFENQTTSTIGNMNVNWKVNYNPTFINHCEELNLKKPKYVAIDSKLNLFVGKS